MAIRRDQPFFIAGAGRVATAFARCLHAAGLTVAAVGARKTTAAERVAALAHARAMTLSELREAWGGGGHLVICVSDDAIEDVARGFAVHAGESSVCVLHTSGLHSADILSTAIGSSGHALAFHPVTSFSESRSHPFRGTVSTVQGDESAIEFGTWLADALGGSALVVDIEQKRAIHAASALLANMTVVLAHSFEELVLRAGILEVDVLAIRDQLLESVLENMEGARAAAALTGPIARGDAQTVERHLTYLRAQDECLHLAYRILGEVGLDIVRQKGDLSDEELNDLKSALNRRNP
jgi:predicted short-subunit dehydrogenase-like oxidoreductase (DUF2520 family)